MSQFSLDLFGYQKERYGRLSYFLNQILTECLQKQAYGNKMSEMRYYSELAKYDKNSAIEAYELLSRAYEHPDCDERTIYLMFERHLNLIDFATHHFTDGYVVDENVVKETFDKCELMIKKHKICHEQIKGYYYYKKLCQAFDLYEADHRSKDFDVYVEKVNLKYTPAKAYYYK